MQNLKNVLTVVYYTKLYFWPIYGEQSGSYCNTPFLVYLYTINRYL